MVAASDVKSWWGFLLVVVAGVTPAQCQKFEITPLFGGTYGGTIKVQQEGQDSVFRAHIADSLSYGIAAGFRFSGDSLDYCEDCSVIEFRWMRQDSHLGLEKMPLSVNPLFTLPTRKPSVHLDHYLGDFTHEWIIDASHATVRPFVTLSLGAARLSAPAAASTRFAFGIGAGVKVYARKHWGVRFQAEYLPSVLHAEVQEIVCTGGCIVALSGGVMNQFVMSIGPTFRF